MPGPGTNPMMGQSMPSMMGNNTSDTNQDAQTVQPPKKGEKAEKWEAGMSMSSYPWNGMPGTGSMMMTGQIQSTPTPPTSSPTEEKDGFINRDMDTNMGMPPRMGGMMGAPNMGMPMMGMGTPSIMGHGPGSGWSGPNGMMGQTQSQEENDTSGIRMNSSNPKMPTMAPGMMGFGPGGAWNGPNGMMMQNENNMGTSGPHSMGMANPRMGYGYGPWGGGPAPNGMMVPQGTMPGMTPPSAIENRLDNIEQRLDELMQHIQNLQKN
jgi:hypothetical protein